MKKQLFRQTSKSKNEKSVQEDLHKTLEMAKHEMKDVLKDLEKAETTLIRIYKSENLKTEKSEVLNEPIHDEHAHLLQAYFQTEVLKSKDDNIVMLQNLAKKEKTYLTWHQQPSQVCNGIADSQIGTSPRQRDGQRTKQRNLQTFYLKSTYDDRRSIAALSANNFSSIKGQVTQKDKVFKPDIYKRSSQRTTSPNSTNKSFLFPHRNLSSEQIVKYSSPLSMIFNSPNQASGGHRSIKYIPSKKTSTKASFGQNYRSIMGNKLTFQEKIEPFSMIDDAKCAQFDKFGRKMHRSKETSNSKTESSLNQFKKAPSPQEKKNSSQKKKEILSRNSPGFEEVGVVGIQERLVRGFVVDAESNSHKRSQQATASTFKQKSEQKDDDDLAIFSSNLDLGQGIATNLFDFEFEIEK